ncbi:probable protein phosphatase 2C 26 isoform X3 [Mangifera indica]|uniref:probable protein phosphatase 2C 26 isoform X3 n=1 Tax=Mangifera indica TaxID=29780 RepID=UPI001CFB0F26|nr:probable protein phosphatase 2C 26 isoform X3 [Mangifera indica]
MVHSIIHWIQEFRFPRRIGCCLLLHLNSTRSSLVSFNVCKRDEMKRVDFFFKLLLGQSCHFVLARTSFHTPVRGGEDAFLVSGYNGGVIAVADGVSGWAEQNVDPSIFSRELMANASYLVEDEEVNYDPQILIQKARAATSSIGSATVIVAMLERNGILKIANIGDCGLRIIRKGQIIFSSSPQEHYFDCPFQLSSEAAGQTYLDAMVSSVELMEGDTIVMGSDGLYDNVFDHEIVSTMDIFTDVAEAAKALADLAHIHSRDSNFDSPYSMEARAKGIDVPLWKKILGMKLTGGKLDDITVIVGQVVSSGETLIS